MNNLFKKKVFYILIIVQESEDHVKLRKAINKMVPQFIIESIYNEEELVTYLNNFKVCSNLILLDMRIKSTYLKLSISLIRNHDLLREVPLILVNSNQNMNLRKELKSLGVNEFYMALDNSLELRVIANDIKKRWLCQS